MRNLSEPLRDEIRMLRTMVLVVGMAIAASTFADAAMRASVLFSESFDDADLTKRNWYGGTEFRIVGDSWAGPGCIEY
jgi:hypothetical protein